MDTNHGADSRSLANSSSAVDLVPRHPTLHLGHRSFISFCSQVCRLGNLLSCCTNLFVDRTSFPRKKFPLILGRHLSLSLSPPFLCHHPTRGGLWVLATASWHLPCKLAYLRVITWVHWSTRSDSWVLEFSLPLSLSTPPTGTGRRPDRVLCIVHLLGCTTPWRQKSNTSQDVMCEGNS